MQAILDLSIRDLESYLKKHNYPEFAGGQIFSWIYKKEIFDFGQMTNLSKGLRELLKGNFFILSLSLVKKQASSDGTQKFLFTYGPGSCAQGMGKEGIESVLIPMTPAFSRFTACVSTQLGCRFACRFCASGAQGWRRNLKTGEIIQQVIYLKKTAANRINNIVFMGVGEPLDNYNNVLGAIRILNSSYGLDIGARKITVSTCGLVPGIQRLAEENLQIELSVSLHAADDQTRAFLMPINKKYPLEELLEACRAYFKKTKRQVTFEYVMIKGINSDLEQARKLTKLLTRLDAKVNLIAVNENEFGFSAPNKSELITFRNILFKAGIPTTIRRRRGADIQAACGQLRLMKT
ncbi:MAG: 23S rRNA (adenine(2503)-C(2))-methyltransferase RlmN [Candidatus Omnitrophota bacterium]